MRKPTTQPETEVNAIDISLNCSRLSRTVTLHVIEVIFRVTALPDGKSDWMFCALDHT